MFDYAERKNPMSLMRWSMCCYNSNRHAICDWALSLNFRNCFRQLIEFKEPRTCAAEVHDFIVADDKTLSVRRTADSTNSMNWNLKIKQVVFAPRLNRTCDSALTHWLNERVDDKIDCYMHDGLCCHRKQRIAIAFNLRANVMRNR